MTVKCLPSVSYLVCFSSFASLLFFFNDTAPTEIYTLSLHDALPIFGVRAKIADELRPIARPTRWILVAERVDLDRKSTRLNSSHQIISYAVFCLKKKKNTRVSFDRRSISHHCDTPDRLDTLAVRTER